MHPLSDLIPRGSMVRLCFDELFCALNHSGRWPRHLEWASSPSLASDVAIGAEAKPKWGTSPWMVCKKLLVMGNPNLKWMIWGYHPFRTPPYGAAMVTCWDFFMV